MPSEFIWRPLLLDVVGPSLYKKLVGGVITKLNINYPEMSPWSVLDKEPGGGGHPEKSNISLQIYRGSKKRQPMHLDSAVGWYMYDETPWAPLSVLIHMNDGFKTNLAGAPLFGLFDKIRPETPGEFVKSFTQILEMYDTLFGEAPPVVSRAGQILAFHPGEQIHQGLGSDYKCSLTGHLFTGRVMLFLSCVPQRMLAKVANLPLFNSEYPWGLQRGGITVRQVVCCVAPEPTLAPEVITPNIFFVGSRAYGREEASAEGVGGHAEGSLSLQGEGEGASPSGEGGGGQCRSVGAVR